MSTARSNRISGIHPTHTIGPIATFKGNFRVNAEVPIPLPPAGGGLSTLNVSGESVWRLPFIDPDIPNDELPSYGMNGSASFSVGEGPLSIEIDIGGISGAVVFNEERVYLGGTYGLSLGKLVPGLDETDLGNIGIGGNAAATFVYDWNPHDHRNLYIGYPGLRESYPEGHPGILVGVGMYNYLGLQIDAKFLVDFDTSSTLASKMSVQDATTGGIYITGTLGIPIADMELVSVYGGIDWNGNIYLSGRAGLNIAGYSLAEAEAILTNSSLTISGTVDLVDIGSAHVYGTVLANGTFTLTGSAELSPLDYELASATVLFNNSGLYVNAILHVPGDLANATINGSITADGHYHLEGTATLNIPGFVMSSAQIILDDQTGLYAAGSVSVPGAGSISMTGYFETNGDFEVTGTGTLAPQGIQIANASFTLKKEATLISFSGNGSVGLGSYTLASAEFSIDTAGNVSGSGTLTWAAFTISASFAITSTTFFLSASAALNLTVNGYGVSGSVSFSGSGSPSSFSLSAHFSGAVVFGGLELASASLSVDSGGNISIAGFPYWCPTLSDWDKICHQKYQPGYFIREQAWLKNILRIPQPGSKVKFHPNPGARFSSGVPLTSISIPTNVSIATFKKSFNLASKMARQIYRRD